MATPEQNKESNSIEKESIGEEALDLAAQQCQRPKMMANARLNFYNQRFLKSSKTLSFFFSTVN